jgi:hypothetical protein
LRIPDRNLIDRRRCFRSSGEWVNDHRCDGYPGDCDQFHQTYTRRAVERLRGVAPTATVLRGSRWTEIPRSKSFQRSHSGHSGVPGTADSVSIQCEHVRVRESRVANRTGGETVGDAAIREHLLSAAGRRSRHGHQSGYIVLAPLLRANQRPTQI